MIKFKIIFLFIFISTSLFAQWEADRKLSTATVDASLNENMGKCIAANGNVIHVVWVQSTSGTGIYYKRSSDAGLTWGSDIRLTGVPSVSDYPSIAVTGNYVHVAYRDSSGALRTSNYIRSTDGGVTWEAPVSLGTYFLWPSIAVAGSNVYIALNSQSGGNTEIWCRRSTNNGANWDSPVQISNAAGRSEDPSIAAGGNCVHIAWNDNRTGIMNTFYRRSTNGGNTWEAEVQRTNSPVFAYTPSLSVYAGDVDLVWGDQRNGNYDIYNLHSADFGATWGAEERLSFDPATSINPTLERSASNVHAIWTGNGLTYLHSSDGGTTWVSPITLISASSSPALSFVTVTGDVVHVIWTDQRDGYKAVYYKRNPTGNAGPPSNVINVTSVPLQMCSGSSFPIQYQAIGQFFDDNVFTAQLSDGNGNFNNPVDIGMINSSGSGTITATLPPGTIPSSGYRVRVNSNSPPATGTKNLNDMSVNVLPSPDILGLSAVCQNSSHTFTTKYFAGHSYEWTVTGGTIIGPDNLSFINVDWTTSSTIGTVNVTETILTTGCINSDSKSVDINRLPLAIIQGGTVSCRDNFQSFETNTTAGHSFKWKVDGGLIVGSDVDSMIVVYWTTTEPSGTITLTETNYITGCIKENTHVVNVIPLPVPLIDGLTSVCGNSTKVYSTFQKPGHSYLWRAENGVILGSNDSSAINITWTSNPSGTVTLIETVDSTGCKDSISVKIEINPLPDVTITGPDLVQKGSQQNYSCPASDIVTYKWYASGGVIFGQNNLSTVKVNWGSTGIGFVKLVCTNSSGCTDSIQKDVSISNLSLIISGNDVACERNFEFYSTPFVSGKANSWFANNGTVTGSSTDTIVKIRWNSGSSGYVRLIQTVLATQFRDTAIMNVTLKPLPLPVITGSDSAKRRENYTYTANEIDGTYLWKITNGVINGPANESTVNVKWETGNMGYLRVLETSNEGCTDSALINVILYVNAVNDNLLSDNNFEIYPNPSSGIVNLELNNNTPDYYEIEITNLYGQIVKKLYSGRIEEGKFKLNWDGSDSASNQVYSGIYFISIKNREYNLTKKVVLIK
ncbi:MAG: T9SS type A sorting domain-containing protein [Ignavibacteriae bacterium]|nr:T9SS type A sorting domain-containing protein [Ignavibacteriota bacterium]